MILERNGFRVELEDPTVYVDNRKRKRSGHMTHAMAEFAPGRMIDFNSNCSPTRLGGHSAYGWVEYRISEDSGKTYSDPRILPFSYESFLEGNWTVSVEKAVACDDGTIVAFCLRNTMLREVCCEPWLTPMCVRSFDGGETWTEPYECMPYRGRLYAACRRGGTIYAMLSCNPDFLGTGPENVYRLYVSEDRGASFTERAVIPFPDTIRRGYCAMLFDAEGILHVYLYNEAAEREMDHAVSSDCGRTWTVTEPSYAPKGIRNPQVALLDGVYLLHGRGENGRDFVFYTSEDAFHWDEGVYLGRSDGGCYYSNNLNLRDERGPFLLVQYSDVYDGWARVNVMHFRVRILR